MLKSIQKSLFLPHFCFPWGCPWGYHAKCCMDGKEFDAYKLSRWMYPSIFNSFPVIRTASAKTRRFHVPQPTFLFPMEQFNACQTLAACTYLYSIFNSFRVIRCSSQCVSPKIAIFTHFCYPWGRPWGNHAKCCMDGKEFDAYKLSRSMYPSIFNSFPVIRTTSDM